MNSLQRRAALVAADIGLDFSFSEPRDLVHPGERRGARFKTTCMLGKTRVQFDVDVAFVGERVPSISVREVPASIPGLPSVRYQAYPMESIVADKVHAIVQYGRDNTRLKDFFDLWHLASFPLDERLLAECAECAESVFHRCGTSMPATAALEPGLSPSFAADAQPAWESWVAKNGLEGVAPASFGRRHGRWRGRERGLLPSRREGIRRDLRARLRVK